MPITCPIALGRMSEEEFHRLDYRVMGLAFSIHNEFGRLYDEKIYQRALAYRCIDSGLRVELEAPVHVSHRDFTKTYRLDLVIGEGVIYELKAAEMLTGNHRKQALNYLLLTEMNHGKLLNMRPPSVEHEFVSTRLTAAKRHDLTVHDEEWQDLGDDGAWLKETMRALLSDWGAFLDTDLYVEALTHFRGGEEAVVRRIDISDGTHPLGTQPVHLLHPTVAFRVTALTRDAPSYERNLRKFLALTSLRAIQWINLDHHDIQFTTILRH